VSIQEEIHRALSEIQKKIGENKTLTNDELETLFLTSLIEEEG
jgi:hypothetical protein